MKKSIIILAVVLSCIAAVLWLNHDEFLGNAELAQVLHAAEKSEQAAQWGPLKTITTFNESKVYRDKDTGYLVRKITDKGIYNVGPTYHLNSGFSADSRYFVFGSMRGGKTYLMRADVQTGEVAVLFEGPQMKIYDPENPSQTIKNKEPRIEGNLIALSQKTNEAAVVIHYQWDVWLVNIETGKARKLVDTRKNPYEHPLTPSFSADGKRLIVPTFYEDEAEKAIKWLDRQRFALNYYSYDCATGEREVFLKEDKWGHAHVLQNPSNSKEWLIPLGREAWMARKNQDALRRKARRVHLYNEDDKSKRVVRPRNTYKEVTHPGYNFDGTRVNYHGEALGGGMFVGAVTPANEVVWEYVFPDWKYKKNGSNHVSSHTRNNIIIEDGIVRPGFISFLDYSAAGKDGKPDIEFIVRHDTKWGALPGQFTHPHAHVSPDGRWLAFNACADGKRTDLYVVDLKSKTGGNTAVNKESSTMPVDSKVTLGERGTLEFTLKTDDDWFNGLIADKKEIELFELEGLAKVSLINNDKAVIINWKWDADFSKSKATSANFEFMLPGIEKGKPLRLLYTWDAENGCFDAYCNGYPLRIPGSKFKAWKLNKSSVLKISEGPFAVSDIKTNADYLPEEKVAEIAPRSGRDPFALADAQSVFTADEIKNRRGKKLYEFNSDAFAQWVKEGPVVTENSGDWTVFSSSSQGSTTTTAGHIVWWCRQEFPESFIAEWDIKMETEPGLCIVFFAATGENGESIFDASLPKRDGDFRQYILDKIKSYHISYYTNTPFNPGRVQANLRKNNNFFLMAQGPGGIKPGSLQEHHVVLVKDKGRICLSVDGKPLIAYTDNDAKRYGAAHGAGRIGLRQMRWTKAAYKNFKVWALDK